MDRPGRLRRDVAGDATRKGELPEQLTHAVDVFADVRVRLGVTPFQVGVRDEPGTTVPWAGDVDRAHVSLDYATVKVGVDEVKTRSRPTVHKQARLDVLRGQRLPQQWVVQEIDLSDGQIVGGSPVGVDPL